VLVSIFYFYLTACAESKVVRSADKRPDKLIVYTDGTMQFKKRRLPSEDAVIYGDGFSGEKAAMKMHPGIHCSLLFSTEIQLLSC